MVAMIIIISLWSATDADGANRTRLMLYVLNIRVVDFGITLAGSATTVSVKSVMARLGRTGLDNSVFLNYYCYNRI